MPSSRPIIICTQASLRSVGSAPRTLRDVRQESVLGVWGVLFDLDQPESAARVDG